MFETLQEKFAPLMAMTFPIVPDYVNGGNKITIDLELTICLILFNTFVVAPYIMGAEYMTIMGDIVKNIWPVALAAVAPALAKPGGKFIDLLARRHEATTAAT